MVNWQPRQYFDNNKYDNYRLIFMLKRITDISKVITICVCFVFMGAVSVLHAQEELILGKISFPTSGSDQAQSEFETGVLGLHSFWYEEARDHFIKAQELDPSFAMAYWGEAMSYDNAFQSEVGEDYEQKGAAIVQRMNELDTQGKLKWTDREREFFNALKLRFTPGLDVATNRSNYGQAMDRLVGLYPDDDEAIVFSALALMSYPAFDREQATHVVLAAAPMEEVYQRNPDHPGVLHYLIHVYDSVTFAPMGLRQARLYAKIAPASSHALHKPSHIYKHLGMWEEVASSNEDSYQASVEWQKRTKRPLHMRDFHAFDWLLDAYLTLGRLDDAEKLMLELDKVEAEIYKRKEESGEFPSIARGFRLAYQKFVTEIAPQN
jgi:hypothetical protein